MFCGAGGSTTGATQAGAEVRLAINHWQRAIETHNTNYPNVTHALTDLHKANPRRFPRTNGLLASPECTSHTLAKGRIRKMAGQNTLWEDGPDLEVEADERSRCTMWTPLDWAECHDYQFVILENVVDAHLWRPFQSWLSAWKSLEYDYEIVYLNSMYTHPTPQSRDRMYFVAWKRGMRKPNLKITPLAYCVTCKQDVESVQCWKNPTKRYGKYRQQYIYCCPDCAREVTPYYYPAATAIDWSLSAQRIGDRRKTLKEKTLKRIAYGLEKFAAPAQIGDKGLALAMQLSHNDITGRIAPVAMVALPTQTGRDDLALVIPPFILDHIAEYRPRSIDAPFSTIVAGGNHQSLIIPVWLMSYYQNGSMQPITEPVPTVTTLDRCALVTGDCQMPEVEDCGFRMLVPKEIQAAMAFPDQYIVTGTRREQVKQLGNAVTPPAMKLLIERVAEIL
jgi:DNA (cytosine-5)-methyltransferase 1